jgi:small subunit ribosomal protein S15
MSGFYYILRPSGDCIMALIAAEKAQIVKTYKRSKNDTGSPEVQIALLSARINSLTEHLKIHKHDFHTRFGLTKLVSQRRRMMRYLKSQDTSRYSIIIKELEIRG